MLADYLEYLENLISNKQFNDASLEELLVRKNHFLRKIDEVTSEQIRGVMNREFGFKNTSLYFTLLLEMKDLIAIAARFVKLYSRIYRDGTLTK